jgi:hypothetical protein
MRATARGKPSYSTSTGRRHHTSVLVDVSAFSTRRRSALTVAELPVRLQLEGPGERAAEVSVCPTPS